MGGMTTSIEQIRNRFVALQPVLDERMRRLWAGAEARVVGRGGLSQVAQATGLDRRTVKQGLQDLEQLNNAQGLPPPSQQRTRRPGGGRKRLTQKHPELLSALENLVEPATRGDPEAPLRWTSKSTYKLATELGEQGYHLEAATVGTLLKGLDYSLQANRKTRDGESHPDRDQQFQFINEQTKECQQRGQPVISVDTKKKELVGNFKNGGREWRPQGQAEEVKMHDFPDPELGKAIPYGVYDVTSNQGWVSVGIDHDTAAFAVQTIRTWWQKMGQHRYPQAQELLIMADGGGSNGYRCRLWKMELQKFADETGLRVKVSHFPPGTSKWNKIEHRLFSFITMNWRGRPLVSYQTVVNLIGNTRTQTGLRVEAELDQNKYPTGIEVSKAEFEGIRIQRNAFHGEWNYTILPKGER
jgi:hypothetical protein